VKGNAVEGETQWRATSWSDVMHTECHSGRVEPIYRKNSVSCKIGSSFP